MIVVQGFIPNPLVDFGHMSPKSLALDSRANLREKLASKRGDTGITQGEIAKVVGIEQATVSHYERNTPKLLAKGYEFTRDFVQAYGFTSSEAEYLAKQAFREHMPEVFKDVPLGIPAAATAPTAPLLGTIGAGWTGGCAAEGPHERRNIPTWIVERFGSEDIFVLDVVGDSMTCADVKNEIPEGSECFFHAKLEAKPGHVVAVWLQEHDMGVLKILRPMEGYTVLESYNKEHPPIIMNKDNPGRICGVYLGKSTRAPQFRW
jgi:SOS-response transcriptional repressor LexA